MRCNARKASWGYVCTLAASQAHRRGENAPMKKILALEARPFAQKKILAQTKIITPDAPMILDSKINYLKNLKKCPRGLATNVRQCTTNVDIYIDNQLCNNVAL